MAENKPIALTKQSFQGEVLESERPVLVDFWADWCAPCHRMAPMIEELAGEFEGRATVAKVNVDEEPDLAARYGIRSIPSLLFFRNGELVRQSAGVVPKRALADALDSLLPAA